MTIVATARAQELQPDSGADRPAVAFMFPGLGDHYVNMALGLYQNDPVFRAALDQCCSMLTPQLGIDLRQVIYPDPTQAEPGAAPAKLGADAAPGIDFRRMLGRSAEEPDDHAKRLNQTYLTQPALFSIEYALAKLWLSRGLRLGAMIGYSLGEYVAATLAGVLSIEDSLTLVARRAQLIQKLPGGAMLAVPLAEAQLRPSLGEHVSLAAINGPEFCVVGGPHEAVADLEQRLRQDGTVSRRVQTSHAFHTPMMAPIATELTQLAATFPLRPPTLPYVSNVTGELISAAQATDPSYFSVHLCQPVRFAQGIRVLWSRPERVLMELGPGQTLSSLAMLNARQEETNERVVIQTLRHAYDLQPDAGLLAKAIARLHAVAALPVATPTDQAAVHTPSSNPGAATPAPSAFRPPQSEVERTLAAVWKELLRVERVGLDDHFFDRGGNSLLATRVIFRVRKAFRVDLPMRRVFAAPTLAALAAAVEELLAGRSGTSAAAAPGQPAAPLPAPVPAAASAPAPARQRPYVLPNGIALLQQNEAETRHFYHDIFEQRSYVKHGIQIRDNACVFDVGGNIGLFSLFAAREARGVEVYTFEPARPLFELLTQNLDRYQVRGRRFNVGLSDRERTAEFTFYPNSSGMSSFHADIDEEKDVLRALMRNQTRDGMADMAQILPHSEELLHVRFEAETLVCKLRRLTDVMAENQIAKIDLIKIDVQKCELEVLAGLQDHDWPKIQQIAIEVHDIDGRVAQLSELLRGRGYQVVAEQDPLYEGTNIHNLYALRR